MAVLVPFLLTTSAFFTPSRPLMGAFGQSYQTDPAIRQTVNEWWTRTYICKESAECTEMATALYDAIKAADSGATSIEVLTSVAGAAVLSPFWGLNISVPSPAEVQAYTGENLTTAVLDKSMVVSIECCTAVVSKLKLAEDSSFEFPTLDIAAARATMKAIWLRAAQLLNGTTDLLTFDKATDDATAEYKQTGAEAGEHDVAEMWKFLVKCVVSGPDYNIKNEL